MPLPVLFSWSGGKDSAMAMHALLRNPPQPRSLQERCARLARLGRLGGFGRRLCYNFSLTYDQICD